MIKCFRFRSITTNARLEEFGALLKKLQTTTKLRDKVNILHNHKSQLSLLKTAIEPGSRYYVTSSKVKKHLEKQKNVELLYPSLESLFEGLKTRQVTGNEALDQILGFIQSQNLSKKATNTFYTILDKSLKAGVSCAILNSAFPNSINEFNVALGLATNESRLEKVFESPNDWFISRKYDGIRCIAFLDVANNSVKLVSRQGIEFANYIHVKESLKSLSPVFKQKANIVLDGELCYVEFNGLENFQKLVGVNNSMQDHSNGISFHIFDVLTTEEFKKGNGESLFEERLWLLKSIKEELTKHNGIDNIIRLVEQTRLTDSKEFHKRASEAVENRWEGLILRKNVPYKGIRSSEILKHKQFMEQELIVEDVQFGEMTTRDTCQEKKERLLSSVSVRYKNEITWVGSGFTLEQRRKFAKTPADIIGKAITVQYIQETVTSPKGSRKIYRLKAPVVKWIHSSNKRTE